MLSACAADPADETHFTYGGVRGGTAGRYEAGSTAQASTSYNRNTLTVRLRLMTGEQATVRPVASVRFRDGSGAHCYANGTGPRDAVVLTADWRSVRLICEEPLRRPADLGSVTVTDAGPG